MPKELTATIQFDTKASRPKNAIVMIYDLSGFSAFFNQPDVHEYVPQFINHISSVIATVIYGGEAYWQKKNIGALRQPVHEKFLGDGALYIWITPKSGQETSEFVTYLCNGLWNVQHQFEKIRRKCSEFIPVYELPRGIRFGLARGTVYELTNSKTHEREYIGFCINLASRLQKYCSEFSFIASARIGIPEDMLGKHGYMKVIAKKIKGFPKEIVVVDKNEYSKLSPEIRGELFESLPE